MGLAAVARSDERKITVRNQLVCACGTVHETQYRSTGSGGSDLSDLEIYASAFPEMGGTRIGPWLRRWAAECDTNIVELGAWLGAGTAQLCLGAKSSSAVVHTYDRWTATQDEVKKAEEYGINLEVGEYTLPRVRHWLAPFDVDIRFHEGSLYEWSPPHGPIGLYVDDAGKMRRPFNYKMETFLPHCTDGCVLVLMDFWYFKKFSGVKRWLHQYQYRYMGRNRRHFECVADQLTPGSSAAVFRLRR